MKKKSDEVNKNKTVSKNTASRIKLSKKPYHEDSEKYLNFLKNIQDGCFVLDLVGRFIFFNDSVCRILGYSRNELKGMNYRQYTNKENANKVFKEFKNVYRTGGSSEGFDWQIKRKDGAIRYIETSVSLQKDSSGQPTGFIGIAHDITERKKAEELLKESETQYRLLADHTKDQVWIMDFNLKVIYTSPSVERLIKYTLEEIKQLPLNKLLPSASLKVAMDFLAKELPKALAAPQTYILTKTLELEFYCKNGNTVWGECMFSFIRDDSGKPVSILGEARDISQRKQMEYELRASESNFRHSLDDSPLGVRISTIEGETIYANKAILDIYGYDSINELRDKRLKQRYTPESYAEWKERKKKRLQGGPGPSEYEISIIRKNGEIRHLHVFRKEIFWDGKKQSQVIYQDITEHRKAEEKLQRTLENLRQSISATIQVLGMASEAKDPYTAGHQKRVSHLARFIAKDMGLSHEVVEGIRMAGSIHDIGKLSVPAEILSKPTKLTALEFSLVKQHSQIGCEMLLHVDSPWPLAEIVLQHHERINGTGYPRNLKADAILIAARIMAVADVVEAMASHRPYRAALGIKAALEEIEKNKGILYDESVVASCLSLFRDKGYNLI